MSGLATACRAFALAVLACLPSACRRAAAPPREDSEYHVDPTAPQRVEATGLTFPLEPPTPTPLVAVRAFAQHSFHLPLFLGHAGDGSGRVFVVEQTGRIFAFPGTEGSTEEPTVFLDLRDRVRTEHNEEGLLGLAFDPGFSRTRVFYVYYSASSPRRVVISRFHATADGASAEIGSEEVLLEVEQPYGNHNGGTLLFGPDGHLYIGLGDGGSAGDPLGAGQDLGTLLAKMLRVRVAPQGPITVPPDNPFVGVKGARPEIWALGLRNPWRCSFDRQVGTLWCGDVGQDRIEEIDVIVRGGNYGWRDYEGSRLYDPPRTGAVADAIAPVAEYSHREGQSVTGGYVYRGTHLPAYRGAYFYADYASGNVWAHVTSADGTARSELVATVPSPSSFGEDEAGELYAVSQAGNMYRFEPAADDGAAPAFPTRLSQTGLFVDTAALTPNPGLLPYDVRVELWSDGAVKRRWLALPHGGKIGYARDDAWTLPVGTVVVKHFELALDPEHSTRLETRVMVHERRGWAGYTYRWNEAQTDADLVPAPQTAVYEVRDEQGNRSQMWTFPAGSDCLRCHPASHGSILGLRTRQIDAEQITRWNELGLFEPPLESGTTHPQHPRIDDDTAAIADRARAYLDVNCAICHHPGGPAPGGIDLRAHTPWSDTRLADVEVDTPMGLPQERRVDPGHPEHSALLGRMRARDRHAMPPLATSVVDARASALIEAFIAGL